MAKKYTLTKTKLQKISNLCLQEQGTVIGAAAEASLMCNLFELQTKYSDLYDYVRNGGWFYRAAYYMDNGHAGESVVNAVKDVICNGKRTLPEYINEHDCFSDIKSISTGSIRDRSAYVKDVTIIKNKMGSTYTFYCFPTATSDPFGYTDDAKMRKGSTLTQISNCGQDENGSYSGGKTGDQTGKEWRRRSWYNRPWNVVLRYPTASIGQAIADIAGEAADNDKIGYDQDQRETFWTQLKSAGYHPKNITKACEADCSSGAAACIKAVGYLYGLPALSAVSPDAYTGNLRAVLKAAGFKELTASKYLTSSDYLLPGDVLLYEGHHTAINLTTGSAVDSGNSSTDSSTVKTFPLIRRGDTGKLVKMWQIAIGVNVDGDFGPATEAATLKVQKNLGVSADGIVGEKTWDAWFMAQ